MKQNSTIYNKKRMSPIETALIGNLIYILMALIFKGVYDIFGNVSEQFNLIFALVEFVVAGGYWIYFNWFTFRNDVGPESGQYWQYILFSLLPIMVLTVITAIIMYVFPGSNFTSIWNQFSFFVAPTLFWYIPFGFLYFIFGKYMPIIVYLLICLVVVAVLQTGGILLGSRRRAILGDRLEKKMRQDELAKQATAGTIETLGSKRKKETPKAPKKADVHDPFGDDDDQPHVIYTEAFSVITDEMLEEAAKQKVEVTDVQVGTVEVESEVEDIFNTKAPEAVSETPEKSEEKLETEEAQAEDQKDPSEGEDTLLQEQKASTQSLADELSDLAKLLGGKK